MSDRFDTTTVRAKAAGNVSHGWLHDTLDEALTALEAAYELLDSRATEIHGGGSDGTLWSVPGPLAGTGGWVSLGGETSH